jgi:hypothetical protein
MWRPSSNVPFGPILNQLRQRLADSYVQELPSDTQVIVLDIDSTDDETHGHQQLTFFHGFYDQHMYHPDQGALPARTDCVSSGRGLQRASPA